MERIVGLLVEYPSSLFGASRYNDTLKSVRTFCIFIGHARSGSTLIGSLLDAHPNALISNEADIVPLLSIGFKKKQIMPLLIEKAKSQGGRRLGGGDYKYDVPKQWAGKFTKLKVIGDRKAGGSTGVFSYNMKLTDRIQKGEEIETKFIHCVRNPYDNISTLSKRGGKSLGHYIPGYFAGARTNGTILKKMGDNILTVKHEDVVANPKKELKRICNFLDLETTEDYLEDCASIIFKKPHKTRENAPWTPELIQDVEKRMKEFPWLKDYSYYD